MRLLIVFLIFASACQCYKILALFPYPGKSHLMVFEPLFNVLAERGHHVTLVSFFPAKNPHPNRRDIDLTGLAPVNVEVVDLKQFDNPSFFARKFSTHFSSVMNITELNLKLCETLLNADIFDEFIQAKGDYDVILVEHFNTDCMMGVVHNYGVPSIGLMTCTMLPWTPARVGGDDNPAIFPNMLLPFTDEMTFWQKFENAFSLTFYKYWHEYVLSKEQVLLEKKFGRKLPPLEEIGRNASVVLINTHYTLNGVRVLPPSVIEVGGIHLYNKTAQPLPEDLERWVKDSKHGVILFSFGSLIRGSTLPPKRLDAILKVFARLPHRVIWKWETENIKNLSDNVLVLRWMPQYDLLHHPNCVAFITHGGLLSVTEAVSAGIPSLIIPALGDQPGNAAYAKRVGIAEWLPLYEIDEENLYNALIKVLTPEMRSKAKAFSRLWSERPLSPMATAVHYIEYTARHGYLNMSSHVRHIPTLELIFFRHICTSIILGSILAAVLLISRCCRKSKAKLKQS